MSQSTAGTAAFKSALVGRASTVAASRAHWMAAAARGIVGTYHHVSQAHLKRYVGEFDFRYNNRSGLGVSDAERAVAALKGIEGKRLTYGGSRRPVETEAEIPF